MHDELIQLPAGTRTSKPNCGCQQPQRGPPLRVTTQHQSKEHQRIHCASTPLTKLPTCWQLTLQLTCSTTSFLHASTKKRWAAPTNEPPHVSTNLGFDDPTTATNNIVMNDALSYEPICTDAWILNMFMATIKRANIGKPGGRLRLLA